MTAQEKLDRLNELLDSDATIMISTALRAWKITRKTRDKFRRAGRDLFRVSGDSLMMSVGRRYDCIDFCKIEAFR